MKLKWWKIQSFIKLSSLSELFFPIHPFRVSQPILAFYYPCTKKSIRYIHWTFHLHINIIYSPWILDYSKEKKACCLLYSNLIQHSKGIRKANLKIKFHLFFFFSIHWSIVIRDSAVFTCNFFLAVEKNQYEIIGWKNHLTSRKVKLKPFVFSHNLFWPTTKCPVDNNANFPENKLVNEKFFFGWVA